MNTTCGLVLQEGNLYDKNEMFGNALYPTIKGRRADNLSAEFLKINFSANHWDLLQKPVRPQFAVITMHSNQICSGLQISRVPLT